jgi:hypothetical protein
MVAAERLGIALLALGAVVVVSCGDDTGVTTIGPDTSTPATTTPFDPSDGEPATVSIVAPTDRRMLEAQYFEDIGRLGARVQLTARVALPDADDLTVEWISDEQGSLGFGVSLSARLLITPGFENTTHEIRARAHDSSGGTTDSSPVTVIVWYPSET